MAKQSKPLPRPGFVYVARKPDCRCVIGLVSDFMDKETGKAVGELIGEGLIVDRVSFDQYKKDICNESTFMNCPHGQISFIGIDPARGPDAQIIVIMDRHNKFLKENGEWSPMVDDAYCFPDYAAACKRLSEIENDQCQVSVLDEYQITQRKNKPS